MGPKLGQIDFTSDGLAHSLSNRSEQNSHRLFPSRFQPNSPLSLLRTDPLSASLSLSRSDRYHHLHLRSLRVRFLAPPPGSNSSILAMADEMDIDAIMEDLDLPNGSSSSNPPSSKPARFHFKPKGAATAGKATAKATVKPKIEPKDPIPTAPSSSLSKPKTEPAANPKIEPDTSPIIEAHVEEEEEEEEEDVVEREIDVFLTPFPLDENETEVTSLSFVKLARCLYSSLLKKMAEPAVLRQ